MVMCVCFANEGWSSRDDGTMVIFDIYENIPWVMDWFMTLRPASDDTLVPKETCLRSNSVRFTSVLFCVLFFVLWSVKSITGLIPGKLTSPYRFKGQSQWPRGLRFSSAAARLLRLRVPIPPGHGCLSVLLLKNNCYYEWVCNNPKIQQN